MIIVWSNTEYDFGFLWVQDLPLLYFSLLLKAWTSALAMQAPLMSKKQKDKIVLLRSNINAKSDFNNPFKICRKSISLLLHFVFGLVTTNIIQTQTITLGNMAVRSEGLWTLQELRVGEGCPLHMGIHPISYTSLDDLGTKAREVLGHLM